MHDNLLNKKPVEPVPRIPWVDVSRGLAFLMVIYSHLPQCEINVMRFFSPVFLTTFFFVSGYLYKSGKSFSYVVEQRLRTLLLPFIILGLIMIGMSQLLTFNPPVSFKDQLKGMFLQNGDNQILWFIAALFIYSILFYFVDFLCKNVKTLLIVATLFFVLNCITLHYLHLETIWHFGTFGFACFYMALGRAYKEYEERIDRIMKWWMLLVLILIYISIVVILKEKINFFGSKSIFDSMILTVLGLIIIITISKKYLLNSRILLFVGANSLFYFAFHGKVYSLLISVGERFSYQLFHPENLWIKAIVAFSIILLDVIILIPPSMFVNKYVPQMLGRRFHIWKTKK